MQSTIEIRKTSITDLDTDAIVNAANEALAEGAKLCPNLPGFWVQACIGTARWALLASSKKDNINIH